MTKYPIDNYYVGTLNLGAHFGNLLLGTSTDEERESRYLWHDTFENGANKNYTYRMYMDYDKRLIYRQLFTLFYKDDEGNYLCLHNGNVYRLDGQNFCSNLKPLKDYLPKISYDMPSTLSYKEAKKLFEATFNSNRILYNDDKYNIDDFYLGTLDLCTGFYNDKLSYSDIHRINEQINIPSELLLSKSYNGLGMFFGEKKEIDGKLYFRDYTVFHTIYMQKLDGLYSIHDYQIYNPNETELKECNSIARINRPLREEFDCRGIEYEDEISIPKVLKLQVKNRI